MKLLFIRHADPDYEHDSLTEKGWREAEFLAKRLGNVRMDYVYVSPLGRARDTANCTLKYNGKEAVVKDFLQEFDAPIWRPDRTDKKMICWDYLPEDWMNDERYFSKDHWMEPKPMADGHVYDEYLRVVNGFDGILKEHGYVRDKNYYKVEKGNHDVIAIFCHFGVQMAILSHLINVSPMIMWHNFCASPSTVTTVYTEERRPGIANFRINALGDQTHLWENDEEPSFAARFAQVYGDGDRLD